MNEFKTVEVLESVSGRVLPAKRIARPFAPPLVSELNVIHCTHTIQFLRTCFNTLASAGVLQAFMRLTVLVLDLAIFFPAAAALALRCATDSYNPVQQSCVEWRWVYAFHR